MNFVLTNRGKEYMAAVNAGIKTLSFTRAAAGSGYSSSLELLSEVVDEKQNLQLDEVTIEGEYTFIHCVLTNLELETEYVLKQIGLYTYDGEEEILIIIGQDVYGDRIPAITEKEVEYLYNIGMRVSNAAEVTFDFSVNDFLRKKYFYEHLEEYELYKRAIQKQFQELPRVKVGERSQLDRKDTLLFELLENTNKVTKILERDSEDVHKEYELAATFSQAEIREPIKTEETLSVLFGKIKKYFADLKANAFIEADDPFVLMTETTYKAPPRRTKGSLYGFITKTRGLIVLSFFRYVHGTENPSQAYTIYGTEKSQQSQNLQKADNPYVGIVNNLVIILDGSSEERTENMLYGIIRDTKGV